MDNPRIALLGCSKNKRTQPCAAREMYDQSVLFQLSLRWASANCDRAYILSAKHGLLGLDTMIEPYDLKLASLSHAERKAWGKLVGKQLDAAVPWPEEANAEIIALAPRLYCDTIDLPYEPTPRELIWTEPLRGLGIGQRLAWFSSRLSEVAA